MHSISNQRKMPRSGCFRMRTQKTLFGRHPQRSFTAANRQGLTLLEVLISSFVVVVGLLSLAALIPIGMAEVALSKQVDLSAEAGRNAWKEINSRGLLEGEFYRKGNPANSGQVWFYRGTGQRWAQGPVSQAINGATATGARPYFFMDPNSHLFSQFPTNNNRRVKVGAGGPNVNGGAFVIDPYALSVGWDPTASTQTDAATLMKPRMGLFPCFNEDETTIAGYPNLQDHRLMRVTLPRRQFGTENPQPMSQALAHDIFLFNNEPVFTGEELDDLSRYGRVLDKYGQLSGKGNYSWFITASPNGNLKTYDFTSERAEEWTVSVAVTLGRPNLAGRLVNDPDDGIFFPDEERIAYINNFRHTGNSDNLSATDPTVVRPGFLDGGTGGGSVTLQWAATTAADNGQYIPELHVGDWVMLYGTLRIPRPATVRTSDFRYQLIARWYEVVAINGDPVQDGTNFFQEITLNGPDWPVTVPPDGGSPNILYGDKDGDANLTEGRLVGNRTFVAIIKRVVAVYEKTIRF
ncbi:Hypothetical protein PBC10988_28330 [Planctomycetales bacterium 10988]|nr:Hypothetical protein PBC10988_28330 [Planctomycetales bacterium 10988]